MPEHKQLERQKEKENRYKREKVMKNSFKERMKREGRNKNKLINQLPDLDMNALITQSTPHSNKHRADTVKNIFPNCRSCDLNQISRCKTSHNIVPNYLVT